MLLNIHIPETLTDLLNEPPGRFPDLLNAGYCACRVPSPSAYGSVKLFKKLADFNPNLFDLADKRCGIAKIFYCLLVKVRKKLFNYIKGFLDLFNHALDFWALDKVIEFVKLPGDKPNANYDYFEWVFYSKNLTNLLKEVDE